MNVDLHFDVEDNFDAAVRLIESAGEHAIRDGGEWMLNEANRTSPYDVGELVGSGGVGHQGLTAEVGYSARHAVPQHERMDYQRQAGRAKWLQLTFQEQAQRVWTVVAESMRRITGAQGA